jgi:hypothetical protein
MGLASLHCGDDMPLVVSRVRQESGIGFFTGGLGIIIDGSERGLGYEGVDLSDEVVCKRKTYSSKVAAGFV